MDEARVLRPPQPSACEVWRPAPWRWWANAGMSLTPDETAEILTEMVQHLLAYAASRDDLDHLIAARDLVQHMGWAMFRLKDIPEPYHLDPTGKALAASVIERLVRVYSAPPNNHQQAAPQWCDTVPPSPVELWLIDPKWADGTALNPTFRRRNIIALANFLSYL